MIGRLTGTLALKSAELVIVDVGGVGYEVSCPLTVLDRLPPEGSQCTLAIHTHVREEQLTLFGFIDHRERALFRMLIMVSGVGPKLALACLSGLPGDALARAIVDGDARKLSNIPGIGKRTAERLIVELRDKLTKLFGTATSADRDLGLTGAAAPQLDDLESALRNLGYRSRDVDTLIAALAREAAGASFDELLREALRRLNQ